MGLLAFFALPGLPAWAPADPGALAWGPQAACAAKGKAKAKPKKKGKKDAPVATPTPPPSTAASPPTVVAPTLPLAAVRLECNAEGGQGRLCEIVQEAAVSIAGRRYQVLDSAKVEAMFTQEPSLRGCRRDDCRTAIAEKLAVTRLIDIIIQSPKRGLVANVSIFDPAANGIAADTEVQLKREEGKLRHSIEEAVDLVITTQRLTAPLRLDIKPAGCKVRLVDGRGGTRELTEAERDGTRDVRVFLGTYTVRVEKAGFLTQDPSVTVAQAGATVAVELKTQPVAVKLEWTPESARVLVDGEPVDGKDRTIEVTEGTHRLEAIAPRGSPYESTVFTFDARVGMEPVRIALQRLTEIHIQAPRGYAVSVDGQVVRSDRLTPHGEVIETGVPTTPGAHLVTATSWRGLQRTQRVLAVPRSSTDAILRPPSLAPGAVIGSLGLAAVLAGGALFIVGYTQDVCTRPGCEALFKPDLPGALLLGVGGAALIVGASWFGWSAANHPRFHRDSATAQARMSARSPANLLTLKPIVSPTFAGILSELRF